MPKYSKVLKFNPNHDELGRFSARADSRHFDKQYSRIDETVKAMQALLPKEVLDKIVQYEADMVGKPTSAETYRDKDGVWSAERTALHNKIIDEFFADTDQFLAKEGEAPQLVVLGGRGGSGKSKLTDGTIKGEIDASKYKLLDPDAVKGELTGYNGVNAALYHEESSYLNDTILQMALEKKMHIIQDVTMKSFNGTRESMGWAQDQGYEIEGHFMSLPRLKAGVRAAHRAVGKKPRYVPLSIIASNTDNEANFNRYADEGFFKKWSMYSNDVPLGQPPKLVKRSK